MDLLKAHKELAEKYVNTVDKATFVFIDNAIQLMREQGENPADYMLVLESKSMSMDTMSTKWNISIEKKAGL